MVWSFLLLIVALTASSAHAQSTCGPSLIGHPCAPGGAASQGHRDPSLNLGVGNPVNLATGNKHQYDIDVPGWPSGALLGFARHYNAMTSRHSVLGPGWSHSYDTRLFQTPLGVAILQADGSRILFPGTPPYRQRHGVLRRHKHLWEWHWPTGHVLRFDERGLLVGLSNPAPDARRIVIRRHSKPEALSGAIDEIILQGPASDDADTMRPHGSPNPPDEAAYDRLRFQYRLFSGRPYLIAIDSRLGSFKYRYDEGARQPFSAPRLTEATRPDGMARRYFYEPEHQSGNARALTGVAIVSADGGTSERLNTWRYDTWGRVVQLIEHGQNNLGKPKTDTRLLIRYHALAAATRKGQTTITTAQGTATHFEFASTPSRFVLTAVRGAGCKGCPQPGLRARYDGLGRLTRINGLSLNYSREEGLHSLLFNQGWPGLSLSFNALGQRHAWHSDLTGLERMTFDAWGRPRIRRFSNGDTWHYRYDHANRPIRVVQNKGDSPLASTITLHWNDHRLHKVEHPHETESLQRNAEDQLTLRAVHRPGDAYHLPWRYTESFEYDGQHRLLTHHLPEGGALHYRWGVGTRLLSVVWQDPQGQHHNVIRELPGAHGYQYGNGLTAHVLYRAGQAAALQVGGPHNPLWAQFLDYNRRGLLAVEKHALPSLGWRGRQRYGYDSHRRLVAIDAHQEQNRHVHSDPSPGPTRWLAWHTDGSLAAQRPPELPGLNNLERDISGLPIRVGPYALTYDANRRLAKVQLGDKLVARYRHNAFGHRIAKHTSNDATQYLYLDNKLVAETHATPTNGPRTTPHIGRRYIYAHEVPIGFIDYTMQKPTGRLYYIHADFLAAPRLVTDQQQNLRWSAHYSATGQTVRLDGDIDFRLRLAGQAYDPETGWHDNVLRTYDPRSGHYLEPDPLGPIPGSQALGYAAQQPRRYADPLGLMLFAFDGTRNNPLTQTNVWKIGQRYQDGPVFYHSGPGNPYFLDWDALTAYEAPRIIDTQWQSLLAELQRHPIATGRSVPIDILGFSRGAALARHFANQIENHVNQGLFSFRDPQLGNVSACVDLRFIGLFDTVAQFGLMGQNNHLYDLSIGSSWAWVAHAVALHERRWLFPLNAATGSQAGNVVEAPFIGAHSDIGGGIPYDELGEATAQGDLSNVALNWMLWQARAASLNFGTGPVSQREVSRPIVHDHRFALQRSVQEGDRRVDKADGSIKHTYQDEDPRLGRAAREATEALIRRYEDWRRSEGTQVGEVDMQGYRQWLRDELGWFGPPS